MHQHGDRKLFPERVLPDDGQRIGKGAAVGYRGAGSNHIGPVTNHIGEDEAHDLCGGCGAGKLPSLHCGQMFAHGVDLCDIGTTPHQQLVYLLQVFEGGAFGIIGHQRRGSSRDEAYHQIILPCFVCNVQHLLCGFHPMAVGDGMAGFGKCQPFQRHTMAALGDYLPVGNEIPQTLLCLFCHECGSLAGSKQVNMSQPGEVKSVFRDHQQIALQSDLPVD